MTGLASEVGKRVDARAPEKPLDGLVSIIIPTYNRRDLLEAAVDSCVEQTWPNIEIVIVDDGSTDDTADYLETLPETVSGRTFRTLVQDNSGPSHARNRGLDLAKGEYIKFLDSDDTMDPKAVEQYALALDRHGVDLCIGCKRYMSLEGSVADVAYAPPDIVFGQPLRQFFNLELRPQGALWFFRSTVFESIRWDESLLAREDTDLLVRILLAGKRVCGCSTAYYNQRVHPGARQYKKQFEAPVLASILESNERQVNLLLQRNVDISTRRAFASSMSRTALRLWTIDRDGAERCYRVAKKAFPLPELSLLSTYPLYARTAAYVLWLIGGIRLCGPLWERHLRRRSNRKRRRRRKSS